MGSDEGTTGPTRTLWGTNLDKRAVDEPGREHPSLNRPERNIDAVLVFDILPRDDVGMDSTWKRLETSQSYQQRLEVLKLLHAAGLELTQSLSLDRTQWIIRISAPSELLEKTAERMGKKFQTKLKRSQEDANRNLRAGYAEFRVEKRVEYEMVMSGKFKSVERQRIILYMIEKALGGNGEDMAKIKVAENERLFHLFPTHDPESQANLNQLWVEAWREFQPLDLVRDYYGEEISMYFAFLGQYTWWLAPIAFFGSIVTGVQLKYGPDTDLVPAYCMAVALWSILFLEYWKRYQATLQLDWNVRNFEDTEIDRIDFYGEPRVSPVTGEDEIHFSDEMRRWKYAVTYPVMGAAIAAVIIAANGVVLFQYFAVHSGAFGDTGAIAGGVMNAVVIQIMNKLYESAAFKMNDYENHQTQTSYNDALIMKVFVFQFVNSYAAIFFMAFLAGRVELFGVNVKCTRNGCVTDIRNLVVSTLAIQVLVGNIIEVLVPYTIFRMEEAARLAEADQEVGTGTRKSNPEDESSPLLKVINTVNPWYDEDDSLLSTAAVNDGFELAPYMSTHEREAHMPVYESTFSDYNELVIQFGYVVMFAMPLPIGGLLCLINNMVEIRSDAFKLVNVFQRPFYRGAQDIGTWYDILRVMVVLGVLSNCGMMAFTSNIFLRNNWVDASRVGTVEMLVAVFVVEHIALTLMVFFADFIPDEPAGLADEEERLKDKADNLLRTKDDDDKSREVLRVYNEMRQLIDEHDIAVLEDIHIKKWRKKPQYGSGSLAQVEPPNVVDGELSGHDGSPLKKGDPAEWLEEKDRQARKKQEAKDKMFEYALY